MTLDSKPRTVGWVVSSYGMYAGKSEPWTPELTDARMSTSMNDAVRYVLSAFGVGGTGMSITQVLQSDGE